MGSGSILGIIILLVMLAAYFLPTIVAGTRGRDGQVMIGLLNVFLGWTVLGWIVLLVVAFTGETAAARKHREEELSLLRQMSAKASSDA